MTEFMTTEEVVDAARNDVSKHIANGTFKKENEHCSDQDENIYTIDSLYSQWAEDEQKASNAITTMFKEEFSKYI